MKKTIYILTLLLISYTGKAQNTGVEKSIYSIEAGFLGAWINNEIRLTNEIALKSEFGMIAGFRGCSDCDTEYALTPELTLEPRWYYNISKRSAKGKIIKNNSANFATLSFRYYPDWFVISNVTNASVPNQITIIPKWGIKRTIANSNFNYQFGIGIGKIYYLDAQVWDTTADLLIRIGYTF
ncbi:MAG TPA: hypothetical protein DCM02_06400 [Flavobacterium sp.]|nr:hypothetical protein [Flavobacterium sp.]HAT76863.1 hypothetical protein [Flavobacterium sp.]